MPNETEWARWLQGEWKSHREDVRQFRQDFNIHVIHDDSRIAPLEKWKAVVDSRSADQRGRDTRSMALIVAIVGAAASFLGNLLATVLHAPGVGH